MRLLFLPLLGALSPALMLGAACTPEPAGEATALAVTHLPSAERAIANASERETSSEAPRRERTFGAPMTFEVWVVQLRAGPTSSLKGLPPTLKVPVHELLADRSPRRAELVDHLQLLSAPQSHGRIKGGKVSLSHSLTMHDDQLVAFLQLRGQREPIEVNAEAPLEPGRLTLVAEVGLSNHQDAPAPASQAASWLIFARATPNP